MQDQELVQRATQYVVDRFKAREGVDLSLHPEALRLISESCAGSLPELRRTGRINVVLPCIANLGKGYMHLDVMVFLDEIERRGGV